MAKVSLIGSGSWGCALAHLLACNGHDVIIWSFDESEASMINEYHEHKDKLPGVVLQENVRATTSMKEACDGRDFLVMSTPSVFVRATARALAPFVPDGMIIVSVSKGIEEATLKTLSEQLKEEIPQAEIAALSGPSHAEEVGREIPTAVVVGAERKETAVYLQKMFMNEEFFRVYTSPDILGIELGGSLKNVIALAAGMADGLGCGDNTKAALITRGISEITRLGLKLGGQAETFAGLAGIGDLIVTCASNHSRNHNAGYLIGQGATYQEAMDQVKMVVEGVYSAKAARALADREDVSMPIVETVNKILFEGMSAAEGVKALMMRDRRQENTQLHWNK